MGVVVLGACKISARSVGEGKGAYSGYRLALLVSMGRGSIADTALVGLVVDLELEEGTFGTNIVVSRHRVVNNNCTAAVRRMWRSQK